MIEVFSALRRTRRQARRARGMVRLRAESYMKKLARKAAPPPGPHPPAPPTPAKLLAQRAASLHPFFCQKSCDSGMGLALPKPYDRGSAAVAGLSKSVSRGEFLRKGLCPPVLSFRGNMSQLSPDVQSRGGLEALRRFTTSSVANAIERLNYRPRNEGFVSGGATSIFADFPPVVGRAVTGRIRSYMPPMTGKCYYDHIEWWRYLVTIPPPRIVVLQDVDNRPGFGALFGEVHARICKALDCVAYLTNGAVRDLDKIEPLGFQLFAGSVSVSHAYAHIVDFGEAVEIGGLEISPGDILHGDRHGILSIPPELVEKLPAAIEELTSERNELFALTDSPEFSIEALSQKLQQFSEKQRCT